jgi:riboflavin synthase
VFTGIVEEVGVFEAVERRPESGRLAICGMLVAADCAVGDSIAVAGVCLTVVEAAPGSFVADVMNETLKRTRLGGLRAGDRVNLERAVRADARLGGHIVSGHVDGIGRVVSRRPGEAWETLVIALPPGLERHAAPQGSIAVEGTSLTIAEAAGAEVVIGLIPQTLKATTLGQLAPGDQVNIETDVLAKYVERLLGGRPGAAAAR